MQKIFLPLLFTSFVYGQSLEVLLLKVKTQNVDLQELQERIMIGDEQVALADTWENPTLGLGVNDLLIDDITSRDLEPMQTQFITLSQKIPMGDKTALKKGIASVDKDIVSALYAQKLSRMRAALSGFAYKVAIIEKKLALISEYQYNVKKLKLLHAKRLEVGKSTQSAVEKAKILEKNLVVKKRKLSTMKRALLYKIENLVYEDVTSVEVSLSLDKQVDIDIKSHPIMIVSDLKVQKATQTLKLARANTMPDVKLGVGYFQREDRSDYLALNVGFNLPVRGKEERAIKIALLKESQAKKALKSQAFKLQREVDILKELMADSLKNHYIIKKEIVPKQHYIQKLLEREIFTKNTSATALLTNLNESIVLELEAYTEMDSYFEAYAKLVYFEGGLS
ncbi:MAG TPA: TolC family protein [Campylobacterales bacterium]|nr:TolC family protein [Campylobacterales bacterium]